MRFDISVSCFLKFGSVNGLIEPSLSVRCACRRVMIPFFHGCTENGQDPQEATTEVLELGLVGRQQRSQPTLSLIWRPLGICSYFLRSGVRGVLALSAPRQHSARGT